MLAALGQAELVSGGHGAVEHLRTAVADMRSGRERCAATILLARAVAAGGGMAEAVNWFEQAAEDARTSDSDLARECEIEGMCLGIADPRLGAEALERAHGYVRGRPLDSAGGRTLLGLLAYRAAMDYEHAAKVGDLADAALADGTLAAHADERFLPFTLSTWAGIHADRFDVAAEQAARVLELGRARGRPLLIVGGAHVLCAVRIRQGRVWEAEAHGWDAVQLIETIPVVRGQAVLQLVEALLARGALEEVGRLLVDQGLEGDGLLQSYANLAFLVRAKWHRAAGRPRDALGRRRVCAQRLKAMGRERSAFIPWRSEAALAHAVLGETEKGRRLAHEEVELIRVTARRAAGHLTPRPRPGRRYRRNRPPA